MGGLAAALGPEFDATHTILAAVRVLHGQRVYRDFSIPHGPIATWLLVPFLWIAPSIGWGVILASAALNGLATAAAWRIAVDAGGAVAAKPVALLTGVWFLPVFGTYYYDHLAYAFVLAAFAAYLSSPGAIQSAACGALLALAYHTKQTVGGPALLAFAVAVLVVDGRGALRDRANRWLLASFFLTLAIVLAIVGLTGSLSDYLTYAVRTPIEYSMTDGRSLWRLPVALLLPFGINPVDMVLAHGWGRLAFYPIVLAVYAAYVWLAGLYRARREGKEGARLSLLAGLLLGLSTLWCSILLGRLYAHVTFGVWTLVGLWTARLRRPWARNGLVALGVLLGLLHIAVLHRSPPDQAGLPNTELRPLLVSNSGSEFDLSGASAAIEYLRSRPGHIALLADSAEVIPLALGRPTFEPVDHYCEGLTVPFGGVLRRRWEERFEDVLEQREVRFLLWRPQEVHPRRGLSLGPSALQSFIAERFEVAGSFGQYVLLARRGAAVTSAAGLHP